MIRIARSCLLVLVFGLLETAGRGQNGVPVVDKPGAQKAADFVFEVQPRVIAPGQAALLRWSIKGATKVVIEESSESNRTLQMVGTFGGNGSIQVRPKETTTYVITCEGSTTYTCASASIRVRVKQR